LYISINIDKNIFSEYIEEITMGKEGMRKKIKILAMLTDGITDEIDSSLISIGISFSNI
jgi:hypothetical protein